MPFVCANDGVKLHYVTRGTAGTSAPPLVLVHGWSASHRYFDNSIDLLAHRLGGQVIAVDLRFHGESDKPGWGFHVARLAADLRDVLTELKLEQPVVCGTSLGAAIIWAYCELYTDASLGKMVFVDQAPSQWRFDDWPHGSKGIYDPASLAKIQAAVKDMPGFAAGNAECCLTHSLPDELTAVLTQETLKCRPDHLGRLMADHAQLDWRPVLPRITKPCLNLYGTLSGCFPVEGTAAVGELIPDCKNVVFEGCNHWLYLEKPDKFAACVVDFALTTTSRSGSSTTTPDGGGGGGGGGEGDGGGGAAVDDRPAGSASEGIDPDPRRNSSDRPSDPSTGQCDTAIDER
jgi:non-heme chloroperoxidase